jgi:hypothetical protein
MLYKKIVKKAIFRLLLIMVLTVGMQLYVKADDPGDPGGDPDAVPLDPGSWVLVAAGVGYGVKKWRDSKQKANDNPTDLIIKDK